MTGRDVILPLALIEGIHLAGLVDEFSELIRGSLDDTADPAIRRLTPSVYPDDEHASQAFADSTRADLLDRRLMDAATVRAALRPFDTDVEALSEEDALAPREAIIAESDLDAWLRTLTAIRLVIASRLEIGEADEERDLEDPRFGVYDWLAYRLEGLIQAADERD